MHTSMSKRLLAGLLSVVMVLSLVAPHVSTQAASKYSITKKTTVTAGKTNTYKVSGVSKTQYVKVTGKASGVVVKFNGKTVKTSTKIKGTGKALSLKVTAPVKDANYTNKMTVKIYNAKTNKVVKTLTTSSKVKVPAKEEEPTPVVPDGVTATLANPLNATYANTVLVNTNAVIRIACVQDGKPVVGQTVVLTITKRTGANSAHYDIKGMNASMTDNNGIATFVIGNTQANIKSYHQAEVASINYTATLASTAAAVNGQVDFASINLANVLNINNHNTPTTDNLVPGTNARNAGTSELVATADMAAPTVADDEYVVSQQVSVAGTNNHAVGFTGGFPMITLPTSATDVSAASKKVEEVNYTSDKYHVYNNLFGYPDNYKLINLSEDVNKLTYATVNFKGVKLSKYTQLVVETWDDATIAEKKPNLTAHRVDQKVYDGPMTGEDFGYQVPLRQQASGKWAIKVYVVSAGQVDLAMNDGYSIKDIVYVFNTATGVAGDTYPLQDAKVTWSIVDTPYTAPVEMNLGSAFVTGNGLHQYTANGVAKNCKKVTYKVPVFPYTGTAIITQYDDNNKVVGYYVVATKNDGVVTGAGSTHKNTNVIDTTEKPYAVSADELRDKTGAILSQDGTSVVVDATATGRTTLEGKVTVGDKAIEGLDAETDSVYTSVQWNPVPTTTTTESDAFVALLGQKIEVYAQLTDVNGNAVKTAGTSVDFYNNGVKILAGDTTVGTAAIVDKAFTTDANGQAKLVLKAGSVTELAGISAKSATSNYKVVLKIKDKTVDLADLYWTDANLAFTDTAMAGTTTATTGTKPTETVSTGIEPNAGENWEYGVYTKTGETFTVGALAGEILYVDGLAINMFKGSNSVGEITGVANGTVTATSTKAGKTYIVSKLDATSVSDKTTFVTYWGTPVTYAGVGTTTINKKLTLEVQWKATGIKAEFLNIVPQNAAAGARKVFFKVTDANGNAISTKNVTFTADNASTVDAGNGAGTTDTAATDANGIVGVDVARDAAEPTTTVTATVDGLSGETFSTTIHWVGAAADAFTEDVTADVNTEDYKVLYNKTKGEITIPMTQDIFANSVNKRQFTVEYTPAGGAKTTWAVSAVDVNGSVLTLHVPSVDNIDAAGKIEVTYKHATVNGVTYVLTSEDGVALDNNKTMTFKPDNGLTAPTTHFTSTGYTDTLAIAAANAAIIADANALKDALEAVVDGTTLTFATTGTGTTRTYGANWTPTTTSATATYVAPTLTITPDGTAGTATFTIVVADTAGIGTAKTLTVTVTLSATAITGVSVAIA